MKTPSENQLFLHYFCGKYNLNPINCSVTGKSILIGCPVGRNSYLHSVVEDLNNMKNFLPSDRGVRWYSNEIITLNNPSLERLFQVVHSTSTDYNFIYFSGFNFTSQNLKRTLALRDNIEIHLMASQLFTQHKQGIIQLQQ